MELALAKVGFVLPHIFSSLCGFFKQFVHCSLPTWLVALFSQVKLHFCSAANAIIAPLLFSSLSYMQKTCDVAEKAILAKKNLRKKCVNRDKM